MIAQSPLLFEVAPTPSVVETVDRTRRPPMQFRSVAGEGNQISPRRRDRPLGRRIRFQCIGRITDLTFKKLQIYLSIVPTATAGDLSLPFRGRCPRAAGFTPTAPLLLLPAVGLHHDVEEVGVAEEAMDGLCAWSLAASRCLCAWSLRCFCRCCDTAMLWVARRGGGWAGMVCAGTDAGSRRTDVSQAAHEITNGPQGSYV